MNTLQPSLRGKNPGCATAQWWYLEKSSEPAVERCEGEGEEWMDSLATRLSISTCSSRTRRSRSCHKSNMNKSLPQTLAQSLGVPPPPGREMTCVIFWISRVSRVFKCSKRQRSDFQNYLKHAVHRLHAALITKASCSMQCLSAPSHA